MKKDDKKSDEDEQLFNKVQDSIKTSVKEILDRFDKDGKEKRRKLH